MRMCFVGFLALFLSCSCVTSTSAGPERSASFAPAAVPLAAPDSNEIEKAHNQDDLVWIVNRFAGDDGTINYRDSFDDYWTWQYVGYAFLRTGDYKRATIALRRVLELKPNFSPAIYNLACVAALSSQPQQAMELIQLLATRVNPYPSLRRKYQGMLQTDPDLATLRHLDSFNRTLKLFE